MERFHWKIEEEIQKAAAAYEDDEKPTTEIALRAKLLHKYEPPIREAILTNRLAILKEFSGYEPASEDVDGEDDLEDEGQYEEDFEY